MTGAFFAGLLQVSDYMKASSNSYCSDSYTWSEYNSGDKYHSASGVSYCCSTSENWLYSSSYTLHFINGHIYSESDPNGNNRIRILKPGGMLSYDTRTVTGVIKPVHLLKTSVYISGGSGTSSSPYTLSNE